DSPRCPLLHRTGRIRFDQDAFVSQVAGVAGDARIPAGHLAFPPVLPGTRDDGERVEVAFLRFESSDFRGNGTIGSVRWCRRTLPRHTRVRFVSSCGTHYLDDINNVVL